MVKQANTGMVFNRNKGDEMIGEEPHAEPGSLVVPMYSDGSYFADCGRHASDAAFKANNFIRLFRRNREWGISSVQSYVDVGCGSGDATRLVADALRREGVTLKAAKGYDVSPHVQRVLQAGIQFVREDFCSSTETADLVTMFDVFEHIPDPIGFLNAIGRKCKIVGLHVPLENSWNVATRGLFREKLLHSGHLVFLDIAQVLNLLASSGLRVIDYEYTFAVHGMPKPQLSFKVDFSATVRHH